jgi:DNA-directed RNA polymerase specialized sigma24 family protein
MAELNPGSRSTRQTDVGLLTLAGIAQRCARETERFFQHLRHDPRYCFELFRRAITERNQRAWELVYAQYRPLVSGWVKRHSAFSETGEEVQFFVNRTFEKMWRAVTGENFARFPNLKSVLRYLQMCVHSVILDQIRKRESSVIAAKAGVALPGDQAGNPAVEDQALERVHHQELWEQINARLRNEQERQVVYGSFVLALKPRELCAQFPDIFRDVKQVYRVKENVLARLRRDVELRQILGGNA